MRTISGLLIITFIFFFMMFLAAGATLREYYIVEKYYPGMTFSEYLMVCEKLRITPPRNNE